MIFSSGAASVGASVAGAVSSVVAVAISAVVSAVDSLEEESSLLQPVRTMPAAARTAIPEMSICFFIIIFSYLDCGLNYL